MTHLDPDHVAAWALLGPSILLVVAAGVACTIEAVRSYAAKQRHRKRRHR